MGEICDIIASSLKDSVTALYEDVHVLRAIMLIGNGPIGRKRLVKELNLGEGSVRTLIGRLRYLSIITEERHGCTLTEKGARLLNVIMDHIELEHLALTGDHPHEVYVIVRGGASHVEKGLQERDNTIKKGAEGALVVSAYGGKIWFPSLTNLSAEYPQFAEKVKGTGIRDGDIMIISWGSSMLNAENGALYSAIELMKKMDI